MSDVFQRQRGLVDQDKLSQLTIGFVNRKIFPQQFIDSFELIGQQLGVKQFTDNQSLNTGCNQDYTLSWSDSDTKVSTSSTIREFLIGSEIRFTFNLWLSATARHNPPRGTPYIPENSLNLHLLAICSTLLSNSLQVK